MTFNSFTFLIFLPIVVALYYALGRSRRAQNVLLLLASYVFYGAWDWRFLSLIWFSTIVDYFCAQAIERSRTRSRLYLQISLVTNLGLLFVFKYFNFFQDSAIGLASSLGVELHPLTLSIVLPVGISFYTFQTLSYTIDVYRGQLAARENLLDFALFVAFFPQLVAGPIERARTFLPQVESPRRVTREQLGDGVWLIAWGYFKKVFVADNVAKVVDQAFAPDFSGSGGDHLVAIWAFAVQIYCDFSGYSDVARGIAKILGFELMVNFNRPYFARNPAEFWHRWHISLSSWLRDYLYISLGGNRGTKRQTYRNLFLTMLLGGLWHGAAWTFVVWGAFHGAWLATHRALARHLPRLPASLSPLGRIGCILGTFQGVCLGWLFFRAATIEQAFAILGRIALNPRFDATTWQTLTLVAGYAAPVLGVHFWQALRGEAWTFRTVPAFAQGLAYGMIFYLIVLYGSVSDSFIYFQF